MALFKAIRTTDDLPRVAGSTRAAESDTIDFKEGYNPSARDEMAKDIAAFANALGGVILIGTSADADPLSFPGMPRAIVETLSTGFDLAHRDFVSPRPLVERHIIDSPSGAPDRVLLAINVHPFAGQVVAARLDPTVWRFPVRVGSQTTFLDPTMLPLYTAEVRRSVILLEGIDWATEKVRLCHRNPRNQFNAEPGYTAIRIIAIDTRKNIVTISPLEDSTRFHRVPLDDVDLVWHDGNGWTVRVLGHFGGDPSDYHSNPRNTVIK